MNTPPQKVSPRPLIRILASLFLAVPVPAGGAQAAARTGGNALAPGPCARADAQEKAPRAGASGSAARPNVLLIGIDTLRADHLGCLGYGKDTTPALDRLAREGVLCTRAMSTSGWTLPSVMSVMTALYPEVHRTCAYQNRLPPEVATLAEVLRADGRTTAGFVSNPLVGSRYGFADGFDLYDDFTVTLDAGLNLFGKHDETRDEQQSAGTGELVTQTAVKWLERGPQQPFFLFVFYMDPHYDYLPPAPFDTMFDPNYPGDMDGRGIFHEPRHSQRPSARDLQHLLALYDGEIRYTDGCVATLLQALARSGVLDHTLIIVFGDHGDEFYEHGKTAHDSTLYQEIVHVPLILWGPGRLPAGQRIDAVTSLVDIMPTVLDYLGVSRTSPLQGASLRPLVESTAEKIHDTVWAGRTTGTPVQAIIGARHKLIRNVRDDTWELYHLAQDPGERTNVYVQTAPSDVQLALAAQWERWTRGNRALADNLAGGKEVPAVPLTEQQLLQLKSLGYAQ